MICFIDGLQEIQHTLKRFLFNVVNQILVSHSYRLAIEVRFTSYRTMLIISFIVCNGSNSIEPFGKDFFHEVIQSVSISSMHLQLLLFNASHV